MVSGEVYIDEYYDYGLSVGLYVIPAKTFAKLVDGYTIVTGTKDNIKKTRKLDKIVYEYKF